MYFSPHSFIFADGSGKDLLETIFFIVVALISVLGPIFNKFLKKTDRNEDSEITVDDSLFGDIEEESEPLPENPVHEPRTTTPYDEQQRERRRQTLLARSRQEEERLLRFKNPTHRAASEQKSVPAPKSIPAGKPLSFPQPSLPINSNSEIFENREALRRAVLAQEILSPPLALRD